jgi:adenosylcobinamide-GDP ribazoletransferase
VGLLLGGILYGASRVVSAANAGRWPEGTAVLLVVGGVVLTRGLHLDGLSDWADGFWGARDRAKVLAIMKDSRTGAFGSLSLILILLAKWACFLGLIRGGGEEWIPIAYVVSRAAQVDLAVAWAYARPEGGTGASFINDARPVQLAAALGLAAAMLFVLFGLAWHWVVALAVGWITARTFGLWCRRRLGGVTGDLLGACSEITETVLLAIGAFASVCG